jgi:Tfp pilus assembly protein PilN
VIKGNLSTRPFYNERAVHVWLLAVAVAVLAATVFNVSRVIRYSSNDTELGSQASQNEARAAELRASAARLRASVDPRQVDIASADARQANDLIDRRTFSWTELLNRFETTLPDNVRITAVRPRIDAKRGTVLTVSVTAAGVDDVNEFMNNLENTGEFADLLTPDEHVEDDGQLLATLEAVYLPAAKKAPGAQGPKRR